MHRGIGLLVGLIFWCFAPNGAAHADVANSAPTRTGASPLSVAPLPTVVRDPSLGLSGGIGKALVFLRPAPLFERSARDIEAFIWISSFRASGVSSLGATLAATGLMMGATMRTAKAPPPISFGPRFFRGGGGLALSLRW